MNIRNNILSFAFAVSLVITGCDRRDNATAQSASAKNQTLASQNSQPTFEIETGTVHGVAIDSTGTKVIAGLADGSLKIFDVTTGQLLSDLTGHSAAIHPTAIDSNNTLLASGSEDTDVKLWNLQTGELSTTLEGMLFRKLTTQN